MGLDIGPGICCGCLVIGGPGTPEWFPTEPGGGTPELGLNPEWYADVLV